LPQWNVAEKQQLLGIVRQMQTVNNELDELLATSLEPQLRRDWFTLLPHNVSREVMATWLRQQGLRDFDRPMLERLTVASKVAEPGKAIDIVKGHHLKISKNYLALGRSER